MIDEFALYIRQCRLQAGLSIEAASELLGVASRTLSYYEAGEIKPPDRVAHLMSEVYAKPLIAYKWLLQSECGRSILPPMEDRGLSELILELLECRDILEKHQLRLISIGKDNIVDHIEEPEYLQICNKCLKPIIKNGLGLTLVEIKKARPHHSS